MERGAGEGPKPKSSLAGPYARRPYYLDNHSSARIGYGVKIMGWVAFGVALASALGRLLYKWAF
jgi:hypothetical protein